MSVRGTWELANKEYLPIGVYSCNFPSPSIPVTSIIAIITSCFTHIMFALFLLFFEDN